MRLSRQGGGWYCRDADGCPAPPILRLTSTRRFQCPALRFSDLPQASVTWQQQAPKAPWLPAVAAAAMAALGAWAIRRRAAAPKPCPMRPLEFLPAGTRRPMQLAAVKVSACAPRLHHRCSDGERERSCAWAGGGRRSSHKGTGRSWYLRLVWLCGVGLVIMGGLGGAFSALRAQCLCNATIWRFGRTRNPYFVILGASPLSDNRFLMLLPHRERVRGRALLSVLLQPSSLHRWRSFKPFGLGVPALGTRPMHHAPGDMHPPPPPPRSMSPEFPPFYFLLPPFPPFPHLAMLSQWRDVKLNGFFGAFECRGSHGEWCNGQ